MRSQGTLSQVNKLLIVAYFRTFRTGVFGLSSESALYGDRPQLPNDVAQSIATAFNSLQEKHFLVEGLTVLYECLLVKTHFGINGETSPHESITNLGRCATRKYCISSSAVVGPKPICWLGVKFSSGNDFGLKLKHTVVSRAPRRGVFRGCDEDHSFLRR